MALDTADTVPDRVDEDCDGKVDENVDATRSKCPHGTRVITGTRGDDTLKGTSGRDCILGYGGKDTIYGEAGDDVIFGGPGDDRIFTGRGRDIVHAGTGNDTVDTTGSQISSVWGDSGNDTLTGGSGNDTFFGGEGNDKLSGGGGADLLSGGGCHDLLVGGHSVDIAKGGADVDVCEGEIVAECERNQYNRKLCSKDSDCSSSERCTVHTGFCVSRSARTCGAGGTTCTPTATEDTSCNGVDDDCSGAVDEDFASESTVCGSGSCRGTGETSCVNGAVVDSCSAGSPIGSDSLCNSVDDDCDGTVDEGYVSMPTTCGAGVCGATGTLSCIAGAEIDSCQPGAPTSTTDSACNGIDDDCDGTVDEGYVSTSTTCGAGLCGATGTLSCIAGAEIDSCQPSRPTSTTDTTCDGVDDDCDGSIDEEYVVLTTRCGVGVCAGTGATSCIGGVEQNSCAPGEPTSSVDSTCDQLDDDCDGTADDDFPSAATSCGFGACAQTGVTECRLGMVVDTCVVSCEGDCADGAEDDGDGLLDCEDPDCQNKPDLWPQCAVGRIGSPCASNTDCTEGLTCETNFPGGYCFRACGAMGSCPVGSVCWANAACVQPCVGDSNNACPRPEHVCQPLTTGGVTTPFCRPDCNQTCPMGRTCRPDTLQCM